MLSQGKADRLLSGSNTVESIYTLFFNKNVVFLSQAEYSYFSEDFRLKIFLN